MVKVTEAEAAITVVHGHDLQFRTSLLIQTSNDLGVCMTQQMDDHSCEVQMVAAQRVSVADRNTLPL